MLDDEARRLPKHCESRPSIHRVQVIAQLEGHLEEARQTAEELKYALDQSVAAEEVGQDCQRRQHDEITVLTEYNEKLKVARMSADTGTFVIDVWPCVCVCVCVCVVCVSSCI
jgi:hypothetical protein